MPLTEEPIAVRRLCSRRPNGCPFLRPFRYRRSLYLLLLNVPSDRCHFIGLTVLPILVPTSAVPLVIRVIEGWFPPTDAHVIREADRRRTQLRRETVVRMRRCVGDRKSVVQGQRVPVRADIGGRRLLSKE